VAAIVGLGRSVFMLRSIEGVFRDGRIELLESPPAHMDGKVIITFLGARAVDLEQRGIDQDQAAELRERLRAFGEDWDRPEMDVYDAV
jgi:hypothetical protein